MPKIDFQEIKQRLLLSSDSYVCTWLPDGKKRGREWIATNPQRADSNAGSFSINLDTGVWKDFACGDVSGGDLIDLYAYVQNCDLATAAKALQDMVNLSPPPANAKPKTTTQYTPLRVVSDDAPSAPQKLGRKIGAEWENVTPVERYEYLSAEGKLLGYTNRLEYPDGTKDVIPLTYCHNSVENKSAWKQRIWLRPRPLYRLDLLAKYPEAQVIVVEGESCAFHANNLFRGKLIFIAWPGGTNAVNQISFKPLYDRMVILWPDFDRQVDIHLVERPLLPTCEQPGMKAMLEVAEKLHEKATLKILRQDSTKPDKWDIKDAILQNKWTAKEIVQYIRSFSTDPVAYRQELLDNPVEEIPDYPDQDDTEEGLSAPFRCLGYDHGLFYYLPHAAKQVLGFPADKHSKNNLLQLAPLSWWESGFNAGKAIDWHAAVNYIMRSCENSGVYDTSRIRGCGAWFDHGRVVFHIGDKLICDGADKALTDPSMQYIYEAAPVLREKLAEPLSNDEAHKFMGICEHVAWEQPIYGKLLAGWCVTACICGALRWRPHLWLTGGSGSGKTTVVEIIERVLGKAILYAQSSTTAAGIMQELKSDAWPILFDEAEGKGQGADKRIQNVLELIRQASSDTGGSILKGSASGAAVRYRIRSSILLSSIYVALSAHADKTRVTVVSLVTPSEDATKKDKMARRKKYDELLGMVNTTITPAWSAGLRARARKLVPVIRENVEVFARAAAENVGTQRLGDQIGTLLAGAYSLYSSKVISEEKAVAWICGQDWDEQKQTVIDSDESGLFAFIMQTRIRMAGSEDRTVGELFRVVIHEARHPLKFADFDEEYHDKTEPGEAVALLSRCGLKYYKEHESIRISNTHKWLANKLRDTAWARNWSRILLRIKGSEKVASCRFADGTVTRGVAVPVVSLFVEGEK